MSLTASLSKSAASVSQGQRLVVLDRDGVINHDSPDYIKTPQEWQPIAGSLEAIARLNHAGWRVVVASNQSGIGRGLLNFEALGGIHDKMRRQLSELGGRIDGIFFCPHKPEDDCECRKPNPGLLKDIGRRFQVDMQGVPVVGDSLRDMQAAAAVGAMPVLVRTGNGTAAEAGILEAMPDAGVFDDLAGFTLSLLENNSQDAD